MAGESSFDVVSDFDEQELRNALDQVRREVQQRYDFKGVTVELTQGKTELTLLTDDEHRATAVRDLIESKAIRRNLSLKIFDWGKVEAGGREQGPPGDRPAAWPAGRPGEAPDEADPRRVPEGQVADPGRRGPGVGQEQGRPPEGDRPPARARRAGSPPVPELPLRATSMPSERVSRIVMIVVVIVVIFGLILSAVIAPMAL